MALQCVNHHTRSQITDGTACVGADALRFGRSFTRVNAVELSPQKSDILYSNVKAAALTDKVRHVVYGYRSCLHVVRSHVLDHSVRRDRMSSSDVTFRPYP